MNGVMSWRVLAPYVFVAPALVFVGVFLYGPVVFSVVLSFSDWNFIHPDFNFVGLQNYRRIFADPNFASATWNTLLYCLGLIPAQILIPLGLAALLLRVRSPWMMNFYKGALFLPTILAYSIAGVAWLWLFDPMNGFFNVVLTALGLPASRWHTDPDLALWCVTLVTFWKNFGLNMLLLFAALISVPRDVLEAAEIDGASPWHRFWTIEVPLISPTFFFVAVTTVMNVLDDIVGTIDVLTGGGPFGQSSNILYYMYQRGLGFFQFGQASASAVLIIGLVMVVTWLQFRAFERKVHYGS
ncbi:MAG: carbohydrate ABC transporter permease [Kiloniellaceae bacterium]